MIEARELRIGNYVNYEQTNHIITNIGLEMSICLWVSDNGKHEEIFCHANKFLKPIPLTEEWLLKARYKREDIPSWIEFVHDLQNWYYYNNKKKELLFNISSTV